MKKVGLALSSGGARGYAHIGVIKVLKENKIPIDCVAGTSMGAVIAAHYALHGSIKPLEKIALSFRKIDMLKIIDLNNPKISIVKGEKARNFLKTMFGNKTFADVKIPLKIGATALQTGKEVIFTSGKLVDAVMASGAFPGVFPAIKYNGKDLVDGGLADATPVDMVKSMGAQVIIAVDLFGLGFNRNRTYNNLVEVLGRTYEIIMSKLSNYRMKEYGSNIIVLKPKTGSRMQTFSFYNAPQNILSGENEARKHIEKIKRLLE